MTEQTIFAMAYARVSTDDHDQNPESQLTEIRRFAKERGIEIVKEFQDKATGTNDDREGLDSMFGFKMRHPEISRMIVLDADRLSRNMDDAPRIIKDFNKIGVQITYVADENLDLTTKEGKLMNAMKSYGAQAYTDGHSLKIKAGLERARNEGKHIGRPSKRSDAAIPCDMLLKFAERGYSLRSLEPIFKCNKNTLSRALQKEGKLEQFKENYRLYKISQIQQNPSIDH